eukprot:CAMPEP_0183727680 /NCGR_PEP_ID=MMETSP0737-20130205/26099_1 /TAXON_ID=385413 /ORGANISM="Thalassiosira miniscula, Strain CCMP1093" /LENGTH=258 /DNA_ID=CAMNT_0025959377 /DNA_START=137 /DNA_END=913 /DNA_ORIENTATION=-
MITKAYIQLLPDGQPGAEERLKVWRTMNGRGIPCENFVAKQMDRRGLSLSPKTLVVGDHDVMKQAFRYLGVNTTDLPIDTYPKSMRRYLKRKVWQSSLGQLRDSQYVMSVPLFVKPATDIKKFTGQVVSTTVDTSPVDNASRKTKIYCSEVVCWKSECRVFVNHSIIVGISHYCGDAAAKIDMETVSRFIHEFANTNDCSSAYAVDFGVLDNGETAMVEWNDGYSLGAYDLEDSIYTDLLMSRWEEVMKLAGEDGISK